MGHKIEVEAKYKIGNLEAFKERAEAVGYSLTKLLDMHDTYLDTPEKSFLALDHHIRVRVMEQQGKPVSGELSWKGPRPKGTQIREDISFPITPGERGLWLKLFSRLGFSPLVEFTKRRWLYKKGNFEIELDQCKDTFFAQVSYEILDPSQLERAKSEVADQVNMLGLKQADFTLITDIEFFLNKA